MGERIRGGLFEEVIFWLRIESRGGVKRAKDRGRAFQAEGTALEKALQWSVVGRVRESKARMAGAEGGEARAEGGEGGGRAPASLWKGLQGRGGLEEGIMRTL